MPSKRNTRSSHRDANAIIAYCELLKKKWQYDKPPSHYYFLWESYLAGKSEVFPWDTRRYEQQREADMFMARLIHGLYKEASDIPQQLTIHFHDEGVS